MIIIRHKNARPVSAIFSLRNNKMYLSSSIIDSENTNIMYFDDGTIRNMAFYQEKIKAIRLIGELERRNLPFILTINKHCRIFNGTNRHLTVVNADCIDHKILVDHFFQDQTKETDKAKLFDYLFNEFLSFNNHSTLKVNFPKFLSSAANDRLISTSSLFIVMSMEDGLIYNASTSLGKEYDGGKAWFFDEKYVQIKPEVVKPLSMEEKIEEFACLYEGGKVVGANLISHYNEDELAEIVKRYPLLFAEVVDNGYSYYSRYRNESILRHLSDYIIFEDEEEEEDDVEAQYMEEYKENEYEAPPGTVLCYQCENYCAVHTAEKVQINNEVVNLCDACIPQSICHVN